MNALTIIVLAVIGLSAYSGYRRGFLRVVYSLVCWVLVLGFVTFATPYITLYIEENTTIQDTVREKCIAYLEKTKEQEPDSTAEEKKENSQDILLQSSIMLPDSIVEDIAGMAADSAEKWLEDSGFYEDIADSVSHFIVEGISFFAAFLVASILVRSLAGLLDIVSYLPVVKDVNKMFGVLAGGVKGLLIVWLAFYILAISITSEYGREIFKLVEESPVLLFLYKNNLLLQIVMAFME